MFSRKSVYGIIALTPILRIARQVFFRENILVLMYHEVLKDEMAPDAWTVIKETEFVQQMMYLRRHFRIVSLQEAITFQADARRKVNDKPRAVVTFDDGYAGNYSVVFPTIESLKIPITIFVATSAAESQKVFWYDRIIAALEAADPVSIDLKAHGLPSYKISQQASSEGRWTGIQKLLSDLKTLMPDDRKRAVDYIEKNCRPQRAKANTLQMLSAGNIQTMARSPFVAFGSHSHCHNRLIQLNETALAESIEISKGLLRRWTGEHVTDFSYPNGDYNQTVIDAVQRAGFRDALTTEPRLWGAQDSVFAIPRIGIGRYDSFNYFKARVSGVSF